MRSLLDINVLIALLDVDHVHNARATSWLAANGSAGWATCPLTQNGCVRIMSQPAYPNTLPTGAVIERLARATRHPAHEFWPDDISILDAARFDPGHLHGPRQVTDLYLLALALEHGGRFVTFDGSIPMSALQRDASNVLVAL